MLVTKHPCNNGRYRHFRRGRISLHKPHYNRYLKLPFTRVPPLGVVFGTGFFNGDWLVAKKNECFSLLENQNYLTLRPHDPKSCTDLAMTSIPGHSNE